MMYNSWLSNFCVYCDNLSVYYVCMILLSSLAVFLTWWLEDTGGERVEDVTNDVGPALIFGLAMYAM